jgi:probable O-glycosylation ligase (exosortase A-associated)
MRDAILILITLALSFMAIRRPVVGMLAFIGYGLLAPHTLTWGVARAIPHSLILAACTIIGYVFTREAKKFPIERETVLILVLWCLFGLSTVFALEQDAAFRQWLLVTKILFMVLLSTSVIKKEEALHALFRVIGLALGFYALKGGLWFIRTGGEGTVEAPEGSFLSSNNSLGVALVMNVPILYFLAKAEARPWLRRLFQLLLWMSYPAIIGTYSRGAWLGLAAVSVLLFLKIKHKFLLIASALVLFVIALPLLTTMAPERLQQRAGTLQNLQEENTAQSRFDSWTYCFRVGLENPAFGAGFDFHSRSTIEKYNPEMLERWGRKVWSCHSSWFTLWSEHGIPGFLIWMLLIVSALTSVRSLKIKLREIPASSKLHYWPSLVQISLVGYLVSASFVDFAYFDFFYQIIAATVMIGAILDRRLTDVREEVGRPAPSQSSALKYASLVSVKP